MNLIESTENKLKIIRISGDIDLYNARDLRERIDAVMLEDISSLIINFKDVNYIDSSGIGSMLHILRKAGTLSVKIVFAEVTGPVMSLIELTKLRSFLPLAGTMDEAYKILDIEWDK